MNFLPRPQGDGQGDVEPSALDVFISNSPNRIIFSPTACNPHPPPLLLLHPSFLVSPLRPLPSRPSLPAEVHQSPAFDPQEELDTPRMLAYMSVPGKNRIAVLPSPSVRPLAAQSQAAFYREEGM